MLTKNSKSYMVSGQSVEPKRIESLYPPDCRFEEVKKLLSFIKSGNSVELVSLPGVGRSNILGLLAYNRGARELHLGMDQKNYHFVLMNFSEIKGRNLADTTKYIFLELLESLKNRKYIFSQANKLFEESIKSQDEFVIFQGLKKTIDFLGLEKDLTIVFLFDRFDEYIPALSPQFFSNLRVIRDRAKYHFSAVFPVNRPIEESVGHDMLSDFYEFIEGNLVYLPISDQKMLDFRISYLEERINKKIDKKSLEKILNLTGGHGKLTRICVEELLAGEKIEVANKRIQSVLLEVWKALSPYEQNILASSSQLLAPSWDGSSHLEKVGLIKDGKVTVPLLETFAKDQEPESRGKIKFDPQKNEIIKGEIAISHGLTSSEFKILKFLVENPDKILGRDEIINTVWGNLASTSGVTEQALDQLIFRLRKKIEENPNSPEHIKTIKGRGFEFNS